MRAAQRIVTFTTPRDANAMEAPAPRTGALPSWDATCDDLLAALRLTELWPDSLLYPDGDRWPLFRGTPSPANYFGSPRPSAPSAARN
jgi:hypothetical protein